MRQLTDVRCPRCGSPITYNGNYYCQAWGWRGLSVTCNWALPHPQETYEDRLIAWQLTGAWESEDGDVLTEPEPGAAR